MTDEKLVKRWTSADRLAAQLRGRGYSAVVRDVQAVVRAIRAPCSCNAGAPLLERVRVDEDGGGSLECSVCCARMGTAAAAALDDAIGGAGVWS